jgi:hypothetical protein
VILFDKFRRFSNTRRRLLDVQCEIKLFYAFFWVIPRRLKLICRRFGTLCLFHIHRQAHLPAYEDGTECSETSAYKLQTPGYYPKEGIKHKKTAKA